MSEVNEHIEKGGDNWVDIAIDRRIMGIEFFVRTVPRVEEFFASLSHGEPYKVEMYGKSWRPKRADQQLLVYRLESPMDTSEYLLDAVCGPLATGSGPKDAVNLSFLRMVGVGTADGVSFIVETPMGRDEIRQISKKILLATRQFLRDHLVPLHINLSISSTEV